MYLSIVLVISSCEKPQTLPLEEDKLIRVLADIHIAESALGQLNGKQKDTAAYVIYDQIYTIHEVREADVDSTLAILKRSPEKMSKIYEKVMIEMEKMKLQDE